MNIKMIVTDLDGTLLHTDKTISSYSKDIFRKCREKGMKVIFATARSEKSAERFTTLIKPDGIISNGGAIARYGGKVLYNSTLSPETTNHLIHSCVNAQGVGYITADTPKGYFVNHSINPNDPGWLDYLHAVQIDFSHELDCGAYKLSVELAEVASAEKIALEYPEVKMLAFSGENWYQLTNINATKWKAVESIAAYLNIAVNSIAAFGDDYNDIEMLKNCGIGIAVANAIDEVKSISDYICDTNDNDGIAKWIAAQAL